VNIIDAVSDSNLFLPYLSPDGDLASWSRWLVLLRCLYGLPDADADIVRQCTGRDVGKLSSSGYSEALLLCGRRSGKSKVTALIGAYEAVLAGKERALSAGEIGMVAILSPTRFQSRIIHSYLRAVFDVPILARELKEERRETFVLKNGIEVSVITGDPRACRGFSVVAAIVDEIAMFGMSEDSAVKSDTELVRALRPSLASTNGRLIAVGTPYAARGHAYSTYRRCYANDDADVLVWNAASLFMNPTLPAVVVKRDIDADPVAANVEYCTSPGLFREDVDEFVSRAVVEALVVRGRMELPPRSGIPYAAFCDVSGGRHDDAALAIGHKEDSQKIVLDCLERFRAPHNPETVVAEMAATLSRYGLTRAVGDAYAAEWTKTAFERHGIRYERCTTSQWKTGINAKTKIAKPKATLYAELLPRLHSGELELLDDELLITQLCSLQRRTRSGARDSIDHPPGGHDDLSNALAGVCDSVQNRRVVAGAPLYDGDDSTSETAALERELEDLDAARDRRHAEEDFMEREHQRQHTENFRALIWKQAEGHRGQFPFSGGGLGGSGRRFF
jgi:hypothetical protein